MHQEATNSQVSNRIALVANSLIGLPMHTENQSFHPRRRRRDSTAPVNVGCFLLSEVHATILRSVGIATLLLHMPHIPRSVFTRILSHIYNLTQ